jgi:two-component system phosphate regulon sensor histidine kinase PhoR
LVTALFVISVYFARIMTTNFVEAEFNNKKAEVFDETIRPFNEFFVERVPEISYYQGYIDSVQAQSLANVYLRRYPFISMVTFYDVVLSNQDTVGEGIKAKNLSILMRSKIHYSLNDTYRLVVDNQSHTKRGSISEDFNNTMLKLLSYLDRAEDPTQMTDVDFYKLFYTVQPGKISYLNIPRTSDLMAYRVMMDQATLPVATYDHDLFVFDIDPIQLHVVNKYPELYEHIVIKSVVEQTVTDHKPHFTTELPLPGALSEYKLQFDSSDNFISKAVNKQFFPVISGLLVIYLLLLAVVYIVYRNVTVNSRLYQLQYDFINNLTHEFKTPVSVIKIAGNNIKSAEKLSGQEQAMYGRILDQEADKLNNLMNKLLSYAQIENKSMKFKGEYIDINALAQRAIDAARLKYPDLQLNFVTTAHNELFADPVLLNAVFQNLIDNAYKYSPVDRKHLDIKIEQNKRNFVVVFRDKGIGIDKKEFNSIFKKFYRVKNQFNQHGSIGLGLAFCKEITEFMGGEIKVDSQVNVGTTFTLVFPLEIK